MKYAKALAAGLLPFILIYLGVSFAHWNMDASTWDAETRGFVALFAIPIGFIIAGATMLAPE